MFIAAEYRLLCFLAQRYIILHRMHTAGFEGLGDRNGANSICKNVEPAEECDFQKHHQFSKNYSSLPFTSCTFDTKERHISDMSSFRKKNNRTRAYFKRGAQPNVESKMENVESKIQNVESIK